MSVGSAALQKHYVDIYKCVRNYILPFNTVEHLVDFELSVYKAIPDMYEVETTFNRFKSDIHELLRDNEDLEKAVGLFSEFTQGEHRAHHKIKQV